VQGLRLRQTELGAPAVPWRSQQRLHRQWFARFSPRPPSALRRQTGPGRGALRWRIRAPGARFLAGGAGPALQQGGLELGAASDLESFDFLDDRWDVAGVATWMAPVRGNGKGTRWWTTLGLEASVIFSSLLDRGDPAHCWMVSGVFLQCGSDGPNRRRPRPAMPPVPNLSSHAGELDLGRHLQEWTGPSSLSLTALPFGCCNSCILVLQQCS
jgi:hypothetical protein